MKDDELANPPGNVPRGNATGAPTRDPPGGGSGSSLVEGTDERVGGRQPGGEPVRLGFDFFEPPNTAEGRLAPPGELPVDPDSGLAPLSLSLIDPPRLLYERSHEPSEDSPILYRERAYLVDNLQSDEELEEQLQAELAAIREDLLDRDASKYVQLALFDHEFEEQPSSPPVATLSWKDWHGRSEVWVRGIRRSSAPPADDAAADDGERDFEPASESMPIGSAPREDDGSTRPAGAKKRSDSGTSWQAPSRSGEYPIPEAADLEGASPSSQRVVAEEELVGALFERMHELLDAGTIGEGATFVRDIIAKYIPCEGALIHVFDAETREFVLVRAIGPNGGEVIGRRTKSDGSHLDAALRSESTLELRPADAPSSAELWRAVGVDAAITLCSPVHRDGRQLGAIDVARSDAHAKFSEAERHALEYICEMFADFALARPLVADDPNGAPPA